MPAHMPPPPTPTHSSVVQLVSGLDTEVECTLGVLKRAHTQDPGENGVKTGLVLDPHTKSIVLNSTPGFLQFYKPERDTVAKEVCVCVANTPDTYRSFHDIRLVLLLIVLASA